MEIKTTGIILLTENYEACVAFYKDTFNLPTIRQKQGLTTLEFGGAYLMIESGGYAMSGKKTRQQNPTVIGFNVTDIEAAAQELQGRGIDVEVMQFDWGTIGVFYDPDGNRCELINAW
jgi:lactoylglutathione lyase